MHTVRIYSLCGAVVQSLSYVKFATPWIAAHQASQCFTIPWSLPKVMSIVSMKPSNHPILCPPLFSCPQSFPESCGQSIEASASASASAWVLPMNIQGWFRLGLTGLIFFVFQGTLKSLLQHHSSKASVLQCPAFFMVQLSHPYMTTGKAIALTLETFVGKVMALLFNMLSMFIIALS